MKIDDQIGIAEKKLNEVKANFERDKERLAMLIRNRAKIEARVLLEGKEEGKRAAELDRERHKLRADIEIYPSLINELEVKVGELKKKKEEELHRKLVEKQKEMGDRVAQKSKELLSSLKGTDTINKDLQDLWDAYRQLEREIGEKTPLERVSIGFQSIKTLLSVCEKEIKGEGRVMATWPAPPGGWPI